jgi:predicted DNA-binding ribbon-helix-helix protein
MNIPRISIRQICDGWIVERDGMERGPYASGEFAAQVAHAEAADALRACAEIEFVVLRIGGDVESAHRMASTPDKPSVWRFPANNRRPVSFDVWFIYFESRAGVVNGLGHDDWATRLMQMTIRKRSVVLNGHKTSVSLEDEFWDRLRSIARERRLPTDKLIEEIDAGRQSQNLSSSLRIYVLRYYVAMLASSSNDLVALDGHAGVS